MLDLTHSATMASKPSADDRTAPFFASTGSETTLSELPAGWEAAQNIKRLMKVMPPGPALTLVTERAIDAVLARGHKLTLFNSGRTEDRRAAAGRVRRPVLDIGLDRCRGRRS